MSGPIGMLPMTLQPGEGIAPFDLFGDLPRGTCLLEAAAGTGKTYTIAALATRFLAEGHVELSELLLITFGRAATSELRERVRHRLTTTHRLLCGPDPRSSDDELVAHLADVEDDELQRRGDRLTRALGDFDAATISTTHGFCQQMLNRLGVLADVDPDAVTVGDIAELTSEVVDDVYLRHYAESLRPELSLDDARAVARSALSDPFARLEPVATQEGSPDWHRARFARDVLVEVTRRKRQLRILDYDDLMLKLRDSLVHPVTGTTAAQRLRSRYAVVMVDEFQDTDPVQWQILRTAFHGHSTLILIGDPKQAIYAFRGGDVTTYLAARDTARQAGGLEATLDRNWRSDAGVVTGLEHLFRGAALGDEQILVRPIRAGRDGPARLVKTGQGAAGQGEAAVPHPVTPVRIRQFTRDLLGVGRGASPKADATREMVVRDVVAQTVTSLTETWVRPQDGAPLRRVQPGDIAVLTRRNADALAVQAGLSAAGVPAVISGASSVFATPAAAYWLTLLEALAEPGHVGRLNALALTPFIGWDVTRLASEDEHDRDELAQTVRRWANLLTGRGVGALLEATAAAGLIERVMAAGGERLLTDVRHLGQVLQQTQLGAAGLADWLRRRIDDSAADYADEMSRRLETDTAAVQVLTVHASKGLEFPIVMVPFAWGRHEPDEPTELRFHDGSGGRVLHVGGPTSPHYDAARRRHLAEDRGEDLRLLYVALTRASSQVLVWWSPSTISARGAAGRLLLGDHAPGEQPAESISTGDDQAITAHLQTLAAASEATLGVEVVTEQPPTLTWTAPSPEASDLTVARWARHLDLSWRRLSYSALTAAAHDATLAAGHAALTPAPVTPTEPDASWEADEPDPDGDGDGDGAESVALLGDTDRLCPLGDLPAGAAFGTLVHEVLERVDPAMAAVGEPLTPVLRTLARERSATQLSADQLDLLAEGLDLALATPLGPLTGDRSLREIPMRDRLNELTFELPLAGGERAGAPDHLQAATVHDIAELLRAQLPEGDVLSGYADRLGELVEATASAPVPLRGYLTGSIDVVLRVPTGPDGEMRYLVADYKTNRLAPSGEPLTAWHYRAEAMTAEMLQAHYPLQMLLYLTALHRFLRWRQPGYDPERHLGGGLYLFLRGMTSTAQSEGVFDWSPPAGLIPRLSEILDRPGVS